MKYSILYMIFEGLSKGGNHLLLLFVASTIDPRIYLIIMLLISFETILPVFVITNYNEVLYSIKDRFEKEKVFSSVMSVTIFMSLFYFILIFFIKSFLFEYFNYNNIIVYLAVALNVFFFVYFRFISIFYQLEEKHSQAIYLKSLPFFLSFVGILCGVFAFEDKVFGFFIGKLAGYLVAFVVFSIKNKIFMFDFNVNREFLYEYMSRAKFLVLLGIFGWLSGYGFLNIVKYLGTEEETIIFGYMLNFYMVLLMIGNGINQVYVPKLKNIFEINDNEAVQFSFKILSTYFLIALITSIILYFIHTYLNNLFEPFIYATLVFMFQSLYYVYSPYYYLYDKYDFLVKYVITADITSLICIFILKNIFISNVLILYLFLIIIRSVYILVMYKIEIKNGERNVRSL